MSSYTKLICKLFDLTTGAVTVTDATGRSFTSDDLIKVGAWASNAEDPWIDLATDTGDAIGLYVAGNPSVVAPPPSFSVGDGMIYMLKGNPIGGRQTGLNLTPLSIFLGRDGKPDLVGLTTYEPHELDLKTPGSTAPITVMTGRNRQEGQGKWKRFSTTFGKFTDLLREHKAGDKDGPCYLQGESADGARKSSAQVSNWILGVDLDSGAPLADVMATIQKHGLEAVIYTTHSHLKDTSEIKRDHFNAKMGSSKPDVELLKQYLIEWKGVLPAIVDNLEVVDDAKHTAEGVVILVRHNPMPKFRAVFPLKEGFVFAKRGGSQQDAINEWKQRYAGFCTDMGFFFDEKCVDPARLFYLPRHRKGETSFGSWLVVGDALDLDKFSRVKLSRKRRPGVGAPANVFTAVADGAGYESDADRYVTEGGFNLRRWSAKHAKRFEIETMLQTVIGDDFIREPRQSGKAGIHVECPFEAEHSSFGGGGTFVVNAGDNFAEGFEGGFTFNCQHNACAGRDRLDFLKELLEREVITPADLTNSDFLLELEEDQSEPSPAAEVKPARGASSAQDEVEEALGMMNRRYAIVRDRSHVSILVEPRGPDDTVDFLSVQAFKTYEENNNVWVVDGTNKHKSVNVGTAWLKWENRRSYDGIGFYPGGNAPANHYNMFGGFPIQPRRGSWALLQEHILNNICDGNPLWYDHTLTWMAEPFQRPDQKTGSCMVLLGEKGTGKSVFADAYSKLFGKYAVTVSQPRQVFGNFNAHLKGKLLLVAEEAAIANCAGSDGIIKDMITGKTVQIEAKGRDSVADTNHLRLMLISNDDHVLRATIGTERRYWVQRCGDRNKGDVGYFAAIINELEAGGYQAMMHDLMAHVPQKGWDSLRHPPQTPHLLAQQIETLTPHQEFMRNWVRDGYVEVDRDQPELMLSSTERSIFSLFDIRDAFLRYQGTALYGNKVQASVDQLSRACQQWLGAKEIRVRLEDSTYGRRSASIPKLDEAREWAATKFKLDFDDADADDQIEPTAGNIVPFRSAAGTAPATASGRLR